MALCGLSGSNARQPLFFCVTSATITHHVPLATPAVNVVEEQWIQPCMASVPPFMHGMCMYGPMFILMFLFTLIVAVLAWCERRQKAQAAKPPPPQPKKKKTTKTN